MNPKLVARELATQLGTILNGRSTPFAPLAGNPPFGWVFNPDSTPHMSYANGLTRLKLSVTVAVHPAAYPAVAWDLVGDFMADTGDMSVKLCLETGPEGGYTTLDTLVVTRSIGGEVTIADVLYKGATFDLDITGSGA